MNPLPEPQPCIGIFDSGVGGLSVLRALRGRLPRVPLRYIADSAHAPYGERDAAHAVARSRALMRRLINDGAQVVVVACNTATALAVQTLRDEWPEVPLVGVEPGIKPAAQLSPGGRVGVMATPATLSSERFQALLARHRDAVSHWHLQPCPGLAGAIEGGALDAPKVQELLQRYSAELRAAQVDTVVLGCTHYPFVMSALQSFMGPDVRLLDTAVAVADRTAVLWGDRPDTHASLSLQSTGDEQLLARLATQWLGVDANAQRVVV